MCLSFGKQLIVERFKSYRMCCSCHWTRQFLDVLSTVAPLYLQHEIVIWLLLSAEEDTVSPWNAGNHLPSDTLHPRRLEFSATSVQLHSWVVDRGWNMMARGDAREGKWRGNWRMQWVASTLRTASEHGVSSITTADARALAAIGRLNWRLRRFKWTRPIRQKMKSGFCTCAITFQLAPTRSCVALQLFSYWCCRSAIRTVDSSWNVMARGDAREGKWRGNWRMQWVASTLHTASEHGVSNITTADAAHLGLPAVDWTDAPPPI
jgi:hypothetical protein